MPLSLPLLLLAILVALAALRHVTLPEHGPTALQRIVIRTASLVLLPLVFLLKLLFAVEERGGGIRGAGEVRGEWEAGLRVRCLRARVLCGVG